MRLPTPMGDAGSLGVLGSPWLALHVPLGVPLEVMAVGEADRTSSLTPGWPVTHRGGKNAPLWRGQSEARQAQWEEENWAVSFLHGACSFAMNNTDMV